MRSLRTRILTGPVAGASGVTDAAEPTATAGVRDP
jgi:hypothetical protein